MENYVKSLCEISTSITVYNVLTMQIINSRALTENEIHQRLLNVGCVYRNDKQRTETSIHKLTKLALLDFFKPENETEERYRLTFKAMQILGISKNECTN